MDRHVLSLECSGADPGGIQEAPSYDFAKSIAKSIFFNFMQFSGKLAKIINWCPQFWGWHRLLGNPGSQLTVG